MTRQNNKNTDQPLTLSDVKLFLATPQKVAQTELNLFLGLDANYHVVGVLANLKSGFGKLLYKQFVKSADDTVVLSEVKGLRYMNMSSVNELAGQNVQVALYAVESY